MSDIKETIKAALRDPMAIAYRSTKVFDNLEAFGAKHPDKHIALLNTESSSLSYNKAVKGFEVNPKFITKEDKAAIGLDADGKYMDLVIASRPIERKLEEAVAIEYIRAKQTNEPFRSSVVTDVLGREEFQRLLDPIDDAEDFERLGIQFPGIIPFDESKKGVELFEE